MSLRDDLPLHKWTDQDLTAALRFGVRSKDRPYEYEQILCEAIARILDRLPRKKASAEKSATTKGKLRIRK